jgi:hypothetical protein
LFGLFFYWNMQVRPAREFDLKLWLVSRLTREKEDSSSSSSIPFILSLSESLSLSFRRNKPCCLEQVSFQQNCWWRTGIDREKDRETSCCAYTVHTVLLFTVILVLFGSSLYQHTLRSPSFTFSLRRLRYSLSLDWISIVVEGKGLAVKVFKKRVFCQLVCQRLQIERTRQVRRRRDCPLILIQEERDNISCHKIYSFYPFVFFVTNMSD